MDTRIAARYVGFILAPAEALWPSATYGALRAFSVGGYYFDGEGAFLGVLVVF